MELRVLTAEDEARLEELLVAHRDTSMFLRSNARRAGLVYEGAAFQAVHVGAFDGARLAGVAAHAWNGLILLQAPEALDEVVRACVEQSGRKVTGFAGTTAQVTAARAVLGLADAPAALDGFEWLYAMDLADVIVPPALDSGAIVCRPPRADERDLLCDWRFAYEIETLGSPATEEIRQRSTAFLDTQIADGDVWVAIDAAASTSSAAPVSLTAFSATLPDIVQPGGIYTPPDLRGRGYARAVVAHSLLVARERGASRAVLFTGSPNAARAYEAVGFRRTGDYSLVLLR
jgi:GNAT superfamily N-acetyltransferase